MRLRSFIACSALALGYLCVSNLAQAQNYRELPLGGRTATMGGAATAAGNDSAMPYLNPAGVAGIPGDIFAISATAYSYTRRSFKNYFYPNGTDPTWGYKLEHENFSTTSIFELPSSVMYMNHLSGKDAPIKHFVGFSLVIPSVRRLSIVASASGRLENLSGEAVQTSALTVDSTSYNFGPSYAVSLGERLRFGATLYAVYVRSVSSFARSDAFSLVSGSSSINQTVQNAQVAEALALAPTLGAQLRLASKVWAGVGVAVPSLRVGGRLRQSGEVVGMREDSTTGVPQSDAQTSTLDADYLRGDPLRINVGLAYEDRKRVSIAGDVIYFAPREIAELSGVQRSEQRRSGEVTRRFGRRVDRVAQNEGIVDFSLGAEVAMSPLVAIRAGAFSDLAATPKLSGTGDDETRLRLDRYGGTLGLGLTLGSFDTTLGAVLVRGDGDYGVLDAVVDGAVVPIHTTETTGMLILSGATTVEDAKRTIRATLPFKTPELPDLDGTSKAPTMPRIPAPLPPEDPPPVPALKRAPPPEPGSQP